MRSDLVRAARLGGLCLFVAFGALAVGGAGARPRAAANGESENHHRSEVLRLHAHFDSVDSELRVRDVSSLTPAQVARRGRLIVWLEEYRDAAAFPINDRFPDQLVPFFRDSKGTLCAMAYLIDRSGRGDIVDRVARTSNNALIPELADDPVLIAWLDSVGLDVAEAARIQPSYEHLPGFTSPDRVGSDFALATLALGGGSLAAATVNLVSPRLASEVAGVLIGGAAIVHGISHLDENRGTKRVANASIIVGSVSLATSVGQYLRSRSRRSADRSSNDGDGRISRLMISPAIVPASNAYHFGIAGTASF